MAIVNIQKFGKYEILEELGRGGMGVVYKARDPIIGRLVALKTLTAGSAADPDLLKRFYREAQAAGRLQHPNIITIFDMGEANGTPYIAMQFLEGETLERAIAGRQPLSVAQKLSIILQLCKGLDFAHKNGVVHRDVKPANIFLGNDGIVRVLDFGIVHIAATTMTHTGMVIGTVPYMSPEQVTGQHVDQRSDIFSVGTVSYEFLTSAKPFDGPNLPSIMYKIVNERPAVPSSLVPDVPPALDQAVMRCLEQRPENRFQSLEDFVLEMEPIEQSLKRQMIGSLVGQGQELYQRKEYLKAKEVLRDVLLLDSTHGLAKELMAKVSAELRHVEIAARVERLVDDGNRLLKQGTPTEAVRVLEEALKLDTQNDYARHLLSEAQQRIERDKLLRQGLAAVHNALGKGNLTVAEAELGKVLQLDAGNHEAQAFQERIKQARAHERRLRIQQAVLFPRHLLVQERYEEAVQQLDQLAQEFPGEAEIQDLAQTARSKYQEQQRRRQIEAQVALAKGLIAEQRFQEAVDLLDTLRVEIPSPEITSLYESASQNLELALREQRLEREMASVQELIRQENYDAALERLQILRHLYPESDEARRLAEFAQTLKQTAEQQKDVADLCREIQSTLDASRFDDAIRMAETALTRFPDNRALASVLAAARDRKTKAAAQLEEERLKQRIASEIAAVEQVLAAKDYSSALQRSEALEKQYPHRTEIRRLVDLVRTTVRAEERRRVATARQTIKTLLDSGDVDRALQEADQALHEFPGNADVTALWMTVQREVKARVARQVQSSAEETLVVSAEDVGAERDQTMRTAIFHMGANQYEQAEALLKHLEARFPDDVQVRELRQAAAAREAPPDSATMVFGGSRLPGVSSKPTPATTQVPAAAPIAPAPPDLGRVQTVPLWKRPAVIAAVSAAAVLLIVVLVWKLTTKPSQPPPSRGPTVEQRALEQEAQGFEGQHQLQDALKTWQQLQAEAGPLKEEATDGVTRAQGLLAQAQRLFAEGQKAEKLGNPQGYATAKSDYAQAGQINADLKPQTDQAIQGIDALLAGQTPEQIERKNYLTAQQLLKAHRYSEAKAALAAIVEKNLPGSKVVPEAQDELNKIDSLVQDQQKFKDAVQEFKIEQTKPNPQYAKAEADFQNLVSRGTEWKADAQGYLKQIQDAQKAAQQAAANSAIDAAMKQVESKLNAGNYADAEQSLATLRQAGGSTDALQRQIQNRYNDELSQDQTEAINNITDSKALESVADKLNNLAQRSGPTLGKSAQDAAAKLQKQIADLTKPAPPISQPQPALAEKQSPEKKAAAPTGPPQVTVVAVGAHFRAGNLREPFLAMQFLDNDPKILNNPISRPPDAPAGVFVTFDVNVDKDGKVVGAPSRLSDNAGLFGSVEPEAMKLTFSPPTKNGGKPTGAKLEIKVVF